MASHSAGADLRSGLIEKLPELDENIMDELLQLLQRQGATSMEDLEYVTPEEIVPPLTAVQARKLLKSFSDKSKADRPSWMNLGKMSLDEYEKKKRKLFVKASRLNDQFRRDDVERKISPNSCTEKKEPDSSSSSWSSWKPDINFKTLEFLESIKTACAENKKVITAGVVLGLAVGLVAVYITGEMNWVANRAIEAADDADASRLEKEETAKETSVDNMEKGRDGPWNNVSEDGRGVEGSVDLHRD